MLRRLFLPCVIAAMLPAPFVAADWQAGFAAVKITPEGWVTGARDWRSLK
jgi:hypothetical protein